jgi:hypothetical protein
MSWCKMTHNRQFLLQTGDPPLSKGIIIISQLYQIPGQQYEPEAVNIMLPPEAVLPTASFAFIIALEAYLIARKQL